MVLGLLPLLVIVAVIVAVVVARERSNGAGGADGDDGHGTLRRVFVYSLALLGAVLTASGLSGVLQAALEPLGGPALVSETERGLALGLSLTVVGLPVWVLAWRAAQRDTERSVREWRSLGRRLHVAAVRAIALSVAVPYALRTGLWLVGDEPYDAGAVARLLVWSALWAYHERVAAEVPIGSEHTRRVDRIEAYLAATAGVALLAVALGSILSRSLGSLYALAVGTQLLVEGAPLEVGLRSATVVAVVGAGLWWWHWVVVGRRDAGSTGWLGYLFLVGVLSATATALVSGSVLLHSVLAWVLDATDDAAAVHFEVVPSAAAGLAVGIAVWGYHRAVLGESQAAVEAAWSGPERTYRYLVAAAGMLTTAGGIATVLMVGLDLVVPGRTIVQAPGGVRDVVAVGLTLLLIGVPLWASSWSSVQRHVRDDPSERTALARRVLIFGAFGVAIVATVVALSVVLFELFDALLAGEVSADLIEEQRWAIALLLTAGVVSVHYGLVLREDRAEAPPEAVAVRLSQVIVVAPRAHALADQLRSRLEVKVTAWERQDAEPAALPDEELDDLTVRLRQVGAARALVIVGDDGQVQLVPLSGRGGWG